ncbi:hypothetical protein HMPREF9720_1104 [Alistipes sp. HGB5]|jgi:hypothetical protein|nr:hypothetical protein HMPREF9720_1104 [Alistipes sp. HGB5]
MWQIIVIFAKNKSALMKKVLLILLFAALLPFAAADAQNIALGERVPELKVPAWLDGQKPAATPRLTYVEFFQSSNAACITSLKQLRAMTDKLGTKLRVVVITQEKEDKIGPLLRPYLSPQISVAIDAGGKIFTAFGVQYVPFGVLVDSKNRALWQGNSLHLTPEIIDKSSK